MNMTDQQLAVVESTKELMAEMCAAIVALHDAADKAVVALPHTNERGESVTHACNLRMKTIKRCLESVQWTIKGVYNPDEHET